jgi:hypothetical protein
MNGIDPGEHQYEVQRHKRHDVPFIKNVDQREACDYRSEEEIMRDPGTGAATKSAYDEKQHEDQLKAEDKTVAPDARQWEYP